MPSYFWSMELCLSIQGFAQTCESKTLSHMMAVKATRKGLWEGEKLVKSLFGAFGLGSSWVPQYAQKVPGSFDEWPIPKVFWYQVGEFSFHKRVKRDILSRDWCLLIWEQCVPEACSETYLGPPMKHSQTLTKNDYPRCRPSTSLLWEICDLHSKY